MARDIIFGAHFTESKLGKTGLTVTFTVYSVNISSLAVSTITSSGSGTAVGNGLYIYKQTSADLQTYYYFAVATTATTTVDQRDIPAVQLDWVDRSADVTVSASATRSALGLASANLDTQLTTIDDFLDTEIAAIKAKTDNLPASPAAVGSAMTLSAGAITAAVIATDAIDADAIAADAVTEIQSGLSTLSAAGVRTAVGLASANLDTQLAAIASYLDTEVAAILAAVDTEIAAIKAKTDNLPSDPADASDIAASFAAISATLATIQALADALPITSEIRADIERVGGMVELAKLAAAAAQTRVETGVPNAAPGAAGGVARVSDLPVAAPTVGAIADAVWDEALSGHTTAGTTGDALGDASASSTVVRLLAMPLRSGRTEAVRYTRGAEGPDLLEHLIDGSGSRINLTGYTITATLIRVGTEAEIFADEPASLGNAPEEGQVELDWPADSLDTPGEYRLIWTATKSGADTLTWHTRVVVE